MLKAKLFSVFVIFYDNKNSYSETNVSFKPLAYYVGGFNYLQMTKYSTVVVTNASTRLAANFLETKFSGLRVVVS